MRLRTKFRDKEQVWEELQDRTEKLGAALRPSKKMSTNTYVRFVRRIGFLSGTLELRPEYKITPRVERKRRKRKFNSPAEVIEEFLRLWDEKKKPECGLERSLEITQRMNYLSKALMLDPEYMTERRRRRLPKSRFHHERRFNLKKKKGKRK